MTWPKLPDLGALAPINGLMEKRSGALIDIDRSELATRMQTYFDPRIGWEELKSVAPQLTKDAARYKAKETRTKVLKAAVFDKESLGNGIFTAARESERAYFEPENFTGCQNNHFEVSYRVTNPLPKPY